MTKWLLFLAWALAATIAVSGGFASIALVDSRLGVEGDKPSASANNPTGNVPPIDVKETGAGNAVKGKVLGPNPDGPKGAPQGERESTDREAVEARVRRLLANGVSASTSGTGGSVTAVCSGGRVQLTAWAPSPGFGIDDVSAGPGRSVYVVFESAGSSWQVRARCSGGTVLFDTQKVSGD
ncbi:unannotated protein [freshwater metagenome]|uniref:Unannotated protein n=1 Tax=freshwater metagenome TaxID=449393 RepID=A0A6J7EJP0_9ZZZZ|nr:hypothetical protein [Actinomycetota bacterium]